MSIYSVSFPRIFYWNNDSYARGSYYTAFRNTSNAVVVLFDRDGNQFWSYDSGASTLRNLFPDMQQHHNRLGELGVKFSSRELQQLVIRLNRSGFSVNIVAPNGKALSEICRELVA